MNRVLVTGSAGFIGSTFVRRLMARLPQVRVVSIDALTYAGDRGNLAGLDDARHQFIHGNICDAKLVQHTLRHHRIDTIVNFAAESHVDRSILGAQAFMDTNIHGTFTLLEAARQAWSMEGAVTARRFHQVSTDEVYGDLPSDAPPSREGDPYRPSSPYAASKAAADHLVTSWGRTYGLPVTLTHGSNTYGPAQYPEKLIPVVVQCALAGQPIPVYGDGRQVRDWLHVNDHADGILAALLTGVPQRSYNIGGCNTRANIDLVEAICSILDEARPAAAPHGRLIEFVQDRPGHDRRYDLDIRRAATELNWAPCVPWSQGLRETVHGIMARCTPH